MTCFFCAGLASFPTAIRVLSSLEKWCNPLFNISLMPPGTGFRSFRCRHCNSISICSDTAHRRSSNSVSMTGSSMMVPSGSAVAVAVCWCCCCHCRCSCRCCCRCCCSCCSTPSSCAGRLTSSVRWLRR